MSLQGLTLEDAGHGCLHVPWFRQLWTWGLRTFVYAAGAEGLAEGVVSRTSIEFVVMLQEVRPQCPN